MKLEYHGQTVCDNNEASEHYKGISPALQKEFRAEVLAAIDRIYTTPFLYAETKGFAVLCLNVSHIQSFIGWSTLTRFVSWSSAITDAIQGLAAYESEAPHYISFKSVSACGLHRTRAAHAPLN